MSPFCSQQLTSSPIVYSKPHFLQVVYLPKLFWPTSIYACVLDTALTGAAKNVDFTVALSSETAVLGFLGLEDECTSSDDSVRLAVASSLRFAVPERSDDAAEATFDGFSLRSAVRFVGFVIGLLTRCISAALMSIFFTHLPPKK
jgi:hypothetical protein